MQYRVTTTSDDGCDVVTYRDYLAAILASSGTLRRNPDCTVTIEPVKDEE